MLKTLVLLLASTLSSATFAQAADLKLVVKAARGHVETADYRATGQLVRIGSGGNRTSSSITIKARWFTGMLRVLVVIGQPSNAHSEMREHVLLEMHPDGQHIIRVAAPGDAAPVNVPAYKWNSSLLGPAFSLEDLLEQQFFWSDQSLEPSANYGARDCNVLKSVPDKRDRTNYSQVRTWLDRNILYPVYAEKTAKESGTIKEFTYFGLRQSGGVWFARQLEIKERGKPGSTLLIIDRGSSKANLTLADFDAGQLTRF